jgi:hypothetical protein
MVLHLGRLTSLRKSDAAEGVQQSIVPKLEENAAAHTPERTARFFGNKRVQKVAATVAGATTLISIPLLAHHPGVEHAPLKDRPAATAAPFPTTPPETALQTTPETTPITVAPTTPPPPVERAPLNPAITTFQVTGSSLERPFPGVQYYRFTAAGPHVGHVVEVDLNSTEFRTRVTGSNERRQTTSAFAQSTGALVAINGDWFNYDGYAPNGLAVSEGQAWSQDRPDWLFLACDLANKCLIDREGTQAQVDPNWTSAIGGNGAPLVIDGQPRIVEGESFYSNDRHPRSAVGLTSDNRMFLVAIEGRQGDASGATFNEMARLLADLGAEQAMMLDGGGSTSLVIGGNRVNDLPTGSGERVVSDHFAIVPR